MEIRQRPTKKCNGASMAPPGERLMDQPVIARMATLARAQVAMALTLADGMQRYLTVTARFGETLAEAASTAAREPFAAGAGGWDPAAARIFDGYRDYVRELAALPGILSMNFYEQLGGVRRPPDARRPRPHAAARPPTANMRALAAELAAGTPSKLPAPPDPEIPSEPRDRA
jgi:hypothetical protein